MQPFLKSGVRYPDNYMERLVRHYQIKTDENPCIIDLCFFIKKIQKRNFKHILYVCIGKVLKGYH